MSRVPQYRDDIKGNVRAIKQECADTMRGEIRNADYFIIQWDDCDNAVREYAQYLTDDELKACFKAAQRKAA